MLLPSGFLPDFGLEVSEKIGEEPFYLTALELKDLKGIEDAKKGRVAINFIPLQAHQFLSVTFGITVHFTPGTALTTAEAF
ncbi:hypothetical protein ACWATR_36005 [Nostoc sp. UIC 10890]